MNFYGNKCPYCDELLEKDDDIAVCPICGTPHHRECYKEHGKCANEAMHASGFEWKSAVAPEPDADEADNAKLCAECGSANAPDDLYCGRCGAPLDAPRSPSPVFLGSADGTPQDNPLWPYSFSDDFDKNAKFSGISLKDWVTYIAQNAGYYIYNFKTQDETKRKICFTWSAMVFPFIYFLYRKVWGIAAIALCASVLCGIPNVVVTFFLPLGVTFGLSADLWASLSTVGYFLNLAVDVFWGLYAVYIYRTHSVKRINALRTASSSEQDFQSRLRAAAGPSTVAVACAVGPYIALLAACFVFGLF